MRAVAKMIGVVLTLAYPLAVLWALTNLGPRALGVAGLCVALPWIAWKLRGAERKDALAILRIPLIVLALLLTGALLDDARFALALPVLINAAMLVAFASSLRGDVSIVERFARARSGDLTEAQVRHCRQATVAWCIFFVLNGGVAAILAVSDLRVAWAIYNGGIAYGLMGLMFAGEYAVRVRRFGTR